MKKYILITLIMTLILVGCSPKITTTEPSELTTNNISLPEDTVFSFYGINDDKEAWADAMYLDPNNLSPGEFEWWYVDGHLDNGTVFVASYHLEVLEDGSMNPYLTINITLNDEIISDVKIPVDPSEVSFSTEICDVQLGDSYIKSLDGLDTYEIYISPEQNDGNGFKLTLNKTVPTFRPGPKITEQPPAYFAWICSVPSGTIEGTFIIDGEETKVTGTGYHDHNWGNVDMSMLVDDWLWSRGDVEGITSVAFSVRWKNGVEGNAVFIAKGNEVMVAQAGPAVTVLEGAKQANPATGKPTSTDCIYFFDGGYVRYDGEEVMSRFPYGEDMNHVWWYTRYDAVTTIDMIYNNNIIQQKGHSTFEVMDFNGEVK